MTVSIRTRSLTETRDARDACTAHDSFIELRNQKLHSKKCKTCEGGKGPIISITVSIAGSQATRFVSRVYISSPATMGLAYQTRPFFERALAKEARRIRLLPRKQASNFLSGARCFPSSLHDSLTTTIFHSETSKLQQETIASGRQTFPIIQQFNPPVDDRRFDCHIPPKFRSTAIPRTALTQHRRRLLKKALPTIQYLLEQRRQFSDDVEPSPPPPQSSDNKKSKTTRSRRIQVPNFGPDADKAVRSLQNARKERARAKTAANVRRALYGNCIICVAKFGAWLSSGSSSLMSEFVHSVVDCGNQSLLLMGLRDSRNAADKLHPYGYGKSIYFWALVSALGTFFLGAGVTMSHAVHELMEPSLQDITSEVWGVLALSLAVDGYVLHKTVNEIQDSKPLNMSFWKHGTL